jgi:hypothetical protein
MSKPTMPICVCGHASRWHQKPYSLGGYSNPICMTDECHCTKYLPDFDRIRKELALKGKNR